MKVTYRITEEDYVAAVKLSAIPTRKRRYALLLLIASLCVLGGLFGATALEDATAGAIGGLLGGTLLFFVSHFIWVPYNSRRNYRKYRAIQQEQWLEVKPEGIAVGSETSSGIVTWENVLKWREDERFVLVYLMPRLFYIVKKEWVEEGVDVEGLRRELAARLGEAEISK